MDSGMDKQFHSSWNHHRQIFFDTVFKLKEEEVFCDVTLACNGALFPAHRLVLAMCSDFFNEILTKVSCQQPMVLLVPNVSAAELEALLNYIYQGEIKIAHADLPSLMKAAQTLKIKGLCDTEIPWEQYASNKEDVETSSESHLLITNVEGAESNSRDSATSLPPYWHPEEAAQEPQHSQPLHLNVQRTIPQVEVFIDSDDETYDVITDGVKIMKNEAWMRDDKEENEFDPLNVTLLHQQPVIFTSMDADPPAITPDVDHPVTYSDIHDFDNYAPLSSLPLEISMSEDSSQDQNLTTPTSSAAKTRTFSSFRYTNEQKLQLVRDYQMYGPVKAARLMSHCLGRKVNESSVRSIVRACLRNQKTDKEMQKA